MVIVHFLSLLANRLKEKHTDDFVYIVDKMHAKIVDNEHAWCRPMEYTSSRGKQILFSVVL